MAMLLRRENDLAVLRIRYVQGHRAVVEFEVQVGLGEPHPVASCPARTLGLGSGAAALTDVDRYGELPSDLAAILGDAIRAAVGGRSSVWLEIPSPCGDLPLLPWERWLTPVVQQAVLRLPYFTLRPQADPDTLDVVLCASSPVAKEGFDAAGHVSRLATRILDSVPRQVGLHLFADEVAYSPLRDSFSAVPDRVVVHDPRAAAVHASPRRSPQVDDSEMITSPWLLWIRDELGPRSVDVVHFVGHGYHSGDRGALAFAVSPLVNTDRSWSRFIGMGQVRALMTQIGAWSFAASGPEYNWSQPGLRELANSLARHAPGFCLVHDAGRDPEYADVAAAYHFLYGHGASSPSPMPTIACWAHPRLVDEFSDSDRSASRDAGLLGDDYSSNLLNVQAPMTGESPSWRTSSTRVLERLQAQWLEGAPGRQPAGVGKDDVEAALRSVSELLEGNSAPGATSAGGVQP